MQLLSALFTLCLAHAVAARTTVGSSPLDHADFVSSLLENPNILPPHSRQIFQGYVALAQQKASLSRRTPQSGAMNALLGSLSNWMTALTKTAPTATVPEVDSKWSPDWPGAVRKKIRYGPYRIPPTSERNFEYQMLAAEGLTNTMVFSAKKPCDESCILLKVTPSMEDANGKTVDDKAWLHHSIILNWGNKVKDYTCGRTSDNLFETGNERTDVEWAVRNSTFKAGYFVHNTDNFFINTELMNMEDKEKWVWLTYTYDYLEDIAKWPQHKDGRIVWMSIGPDRCSTSDKNPFGNTNLTASQQPKQLVFSEFSVPWIAKADGHIIGINAHMHDGGVATDVFLNGKSICSSIPKYSATGKAGMGYMGAGGAASGGSHGHRMRKIRRQAAMAGNHVNEGIEHIDGQMGCQFDPPLNLKKGDEMHIRSDYDFTKHPGMKNRKGELDEVMGIVGTLIAFN